MKIAVFLNIKCTSSGGHYWAEEQYYKFWIALADSFTHMYLCLPLRESSVHGNFKMQFDPKRVSIVAMPYYESSRDLYLKLPYYFHQINQRMKGLWNSLDVFTAVVPNPFGLYLVHQAQKRKLASAFYIRGNFINSVRFEYSNSKFKWIPLCVAYFMEFLAQRMMKHTRTFVVGKELAEIYSKKGIAAIPIVTSLISASDVVKPRKIMEKEELRILHVGRFSREKGVETLLEAFSLLQAKYHGIQLELVGDGPERPNLEQLAKKQGLNVVFTGFLPFGEELKAKYQNADLFVLPSFTEGFPKVLLEAMANGCPIVTTDVGSISWVMTHEKDCLIVPARNAMKLAQSMERMLESRELRQSMMNEALLTVTNFTIERLSRIFINETIGTKAD